MRKKILKVIFVGGLAAGFLAVCPAYAIDLGHSTLGAVQGGNQDEGKPVEVTNLPIQPLVKRVNNEDQSIPHVRVLDADNDTREIAKDLALPFGESYESSPIDVREYRDVAFYVIPDQSMTDPVTVLYRLDAYFSVTLGTQKIQKMGESSKKISGSGFQEFGNMEVSDKDQELRSSFRKLTTGETSSRVLVTKVYGPFVHVVLKNLTPDSKRRFKILAYLTR